MTFARFALSRQLIAEERVGKLAREAGRADDAAWQQATAALGKLK